MFTDFKSDQEMRARSFLQSILQNPQRHARFVNTLSLLEHIGSRKIVYSHIALTLLDGACLKHLAEETRHAVFFKKAAESLAGRQMGFALVDILGHRRVFSYLNRLDAIITRTVGASKAYEFMSYIVEVRALWFYTLYQEVLSVCGNKLSLKSILAEEKKHLEQMRFSLGLGLSSKGIVKCLEFEARLFGELMTQLETMPAT